jgi:hypothetical protein
VGYAFIKPLNATVSGGLFTVGMLARHVASKIRG